MPAEGEQTRFQFHKGTIKTNVVAALVGSMPKFQFHKGTIKTLLVLLLVASIPSFNSTIVRLKV